MGSYPLKIRRFFNSKKGLFAMLAACVMFSLMNTSVYAVRVIEPATTAMIISFFRVFINWLVLVIPALVQCKVKNLFGDCSYSLWLRGLFGGSALILSFESIVRIGVGESAFLGASSGLFVAMLSPWFLGQKNSWLTWLAILGSLGGVFLLFKGNDGSTHNFFGRAMALGSGFLAALAYILVARAGRTNSAQSVIFYFCFFALILHGGYFAVHGYQLPTDARVWAVLIFIGLVGSGGQHMMTRAYQTAPAALVSALGYLTPVLSLCWGIVLFAQIPTLYAIAGSVLIVVFGVLLPFMH